MSLGLGKLGRAKHKAMIEEHLLKTAKRPTHLVAEHQPIIFQSGLVKVLTQI